MPDAVWERIKLHFTRTELVDLKLLVNAIDAWNRFVIAFRTLPVTNTRERCVAVNNILAASVINVDWIPPIEGPIHGKRIYKSFCFPQAATREYPVLVVGG